MVVLRTFLIEIEITVLGVIESMRKESVGLQIMDSLGLPMAMRLGFTRPRNC